MPHSGQGRRMGTDKSCSVTSCMPICMPADTPDSMRRFRAASRRPALAAHVPLTKTVSSFTKHSLRCVLEAGRAPSRYEWGVRKSRSGLGD
jgi:hypothetical protein